MKDSEYRLYVGPGALKGPLIRPRRARVLLSITHMYANFGPLKGPSNKGAPHPLFAAQIHEERPGGLLNSIKYFKMPPNKGIL